MARPRLIGSCHNNQPLYPPIHRLDWQAIKLSSHQFWQDFDVAMMRLAIDEAKKGAVAGEIPVGAILVHDGQVIGKGFNQPILSHDPTAHAEIVALRDACAQLNNYRLPPQTTLYVTLEPCTMCFGALVHARVARIVFATFEPKSGVVGSQLDLSQMGFYNHQATVSHGLLSCECSQMLSQFFAQRRVDKRLAKQMAISKV